MALEITRCIASRRSNARESVSRAPCGPTAVSGGVVVGVDPLFGGTTKPTDNSIVANDFGRNKPDIFFDQSGIGNRFRANNCNTSVPTRLCD
jgi:hypothetical protein